MTTSTESTTSTTGGATSGSGRSPQTGLQAANAVLTSADPSVACDTDYVTTHYLDVAYGGKAGCVQAKAARNAAQKVNFNHIASPQPGRETLKAIPEGGLYDGEKLTVSTVHVDGGWRVDALKSNAPVGP